MVEYLNLLKTVLNKNQYKNDRTNTGVLSEFGPQMEFDLQAGFPLLTTKKVHFKSVVHELIWFISGNTNIKYLVDNDVKIWNEWPYEKYKQSQCYKNESLKEFIDKIKKSESFAKKHGDLGPVYGKQWRNFNGVDQLTNLINEIKSNPNSRRLVISAWNPSEIKNMLLPPCHVLMQFYVSRENELSCKLYQRSADIFLGVPFNIASYALLTHLIAHVCNLKPKKFIHTIGDAHIYQNHLEAVKIQLSRTPKSLPTLKLNKQIKNVFDFKYEDIVLENYESWPLIKGKVAV
ncbi:thymidylate synthase [Spiroplasma endosymbiont of Amphibalanus improvisus]|uniref:thymidylate synthase n=1 Tax=Spiroplasma endosymbiont of Amphibalanus improvisus TaxID=3066327 RepID=UPI00313A7E81